MIKKVNTKKVSFGKTTESGHAEPALSCDERKSLCWYSESELADCREEAREAVEALHAAGGDYKAIDESKTCMRGIEKYGDIVAKVACQRRLIESVLSQQSANRSKENQSDSLDTSNKNGQEQLLAIISKVLSQPSVEIAKLHAANNANQVLQDCTHRVAEDDSKHSVVPIQSIDSSEVDALLVEVVDESCTQPGKKRRRERCCDEMTDMDRRNVKQLMRSIV